MSEIKNKETMWLEKVLNYFVNEKRLHQWRFLPDEGKKKKVELRLCSHVAESFAKRVGNITVSGEFQVVTEESYAKLAELCWGILYNQLETTEHRYKDKLLSPIKHYFAEEKLARWAKWKKENAPK